MRLRGRFGLAPDVARALALLATLSGAIPAPAAAQDPAPRLTTVESLRRFPPYYHLQPVLVRGEFVERGTDLVLLADGHEIRLLNPDAARGSGPVDVRGQLVDVGRLESDDPRLRTYKRPPDAQDWPRPGTELVLHVASVAAARPASDPTLRAVALEPWRFVGRTITLRGNFRGRNLFGDLPAAPGRGRDDFVLGGADGALWVTGREPRGRNFDLDVQRRVDTDKWLEVTGVVSRCDTMVCLEAKDMALTQSPGPAVVTPAPTPEPSLVSVLGPPPPAQVVFSIPVADQTNVDSATTVRVQFSKGLRDATLEGRVRVTYAGQNAPPAPEFTTSYDSLTRALRITFARPLEPSSTVVVEILDGVAAFDGAPILPWRLTFSVANR